MAKVVVIDDSKMMRRFLRQHLEAEGHEVEEWTDLAAMEIPGKIHAAKPDLVISDYVMPGCNGLTVAKMVRKAQPDLAVLIITSLHDPEIAEQLHKQQVAGILQKPLDLAKLKEAMQLLL
jgi:DNA-binding NtrC family response regulator